MKKRVLTQEELGIVIKMNNEFYSFKKIGETTINCMLDDYTKQK